MAIRGPSRRAPFEYDGVNFVMSAESFLRNDGCYERRNKNYMSHLSHEAQLARHATATCLVAVAVNNRYGWNLR